MIDESTSVVDDDLTDFGAEHCRSRVAYLVHRPLRSLNVRRHLRPRRRNSARCNFAARREHVVMLEPFDKDGTHWWRKVRSTRPSATRPLS
jgi:hypothetical protein